MNLPAGDKFSSTTIPPYFVDLIYSSKSRTRLDSNSKLFDDDSVNDKLVDIINLCFDMFVGIDILSAVCYFTVYKIIGIKSNSINQLILYDEDGLTITKFSYNDGCRSTIEISNDLMKFTIRLPEYFIYQHNTDAINTIVDNFKMLTSISPRISRKSANN